MINEKGEYNKVSLTPSFNSSIYEYKCEVPKEVTELSVEAVPNNEKMAIEILGNKNLHEGENVVTIIVKDTENEETLTYQILVQKSSIETNIISSQNKNQNENPNIRKIIFVSCVIAIVILGISFGIIEYKYSKDNSYDEDEEDEEDEDDDYDDEREKSKNQILNSGDKGGRHF